MFSVRLLLASIIICLAGMQIPVSAQLSQGGKPIEFSRLNRRVAKSIVDLPRVDNGKLLKISLDRQIKNPLKSLLFAEPITVSLNTANSGQWVEKDDCRVWTLEIRSEGAKSLNLIFDHYYLPDGARLFIYSADKQDLIGAFTSINNKQSGILPTSPVIGDHLVVQYEEPVDADFHADLSIGQVNHDFYGIKSIKDERRPLGLSGSCNININCDALESHKLQANSVARIVVSGTELCSGSLINNTRQDGTPYLYSAGHCISTAREAEESVFLFNYESPYCGEIDGDASRSISGSMLKAQSDSLDFSMVELSIEPPRSYRPYYLGWDRSEVFPDSSVCIHHPQGDVKKIAIDRHGPQVVSYNDDYVDDAFYIIGRWEHGTTEGGSSGAALINQDGHLVGSLTGGAATCENPSNDYFARINFAWDHYNNPSQSVKSWLDPGNTNVSSIDGYLPYSEDETCGAFTNFTDDDTHESLSIVEGGQLKGLWSGNNDYGYVSFAEKIEQNSSCDIAGVALGVSVASGFNADPQSKIRIQVYNGNFVPLELIYEQEYDLRDIEQGVMNYFAFNQIVNTSGKFFVSYSIDMLQPMDLFGVYLAKRVVNPLNTFYIKDGDEWYPYQQKTGGIEGSALLMEVILCNVDPEDNNHILKNEKLLLSAFPNPLRSDQVLYLKFQEEVNPDRVEVFDLLGRQFPMSFDQPATNWLTLNFQGKHPGTYLVRVFSGDKSYQAKIVYLGM